LLAELLPDGQRLALVSWLDFAATIAGPATAGVLVTYARARESDAAPVQVHGMDYRGAEDHEQQADSNARVRQVRRRLGGPGRVKQHSSHAVRLAYGESPYDYRIDQESRSAGHRAALA
jgi:hypothetical protein